MEFKIRLFKIKTLLLILPVFLVTCEKNGGDSLESYPAAFHQSAIITIGGPRVFTANGEVMSPSIVNKLFERDSSLFNDFIRAMRRNGDIMDTILFTDAQHVNVNSKYSSYRCIVKHEPQQIILSRMDTTVGYTFGESLTRSTQYLIGEVKPELINEYLYSSTRGNFEFGYKIREKYVLKKQGRSWAAPIFQYSERGGIWNAWWFLNNYVHKDFHKYLLPGDTVTLREYMILYEPLK